MGEQTFRKLLAAGVPLPFGSGAVPERYPHGKQADQFPYFVKWGMTPAQALQTALHGRRECLELQLGRSRREHREGKFADLIAVCGQSARRRHRDAARDVRDEGRSRRPQRPAGAIGVSRASPMPLPLRRPADHERRRQPLSSPTGSDWIQALQRKGPRGLDGEDRRIRPQRQLRQYISRGKRRDESRL